LMCFFCADFTRALRRSFCRSARTPSHTAWVLTSLTAHVNGLACHACQIRLDDTIPTRATARGHSLRPAFFTRTCVTAACRFLMHISIPVDRKPLEHAADVTSFIQFERWSPGQRQHAPAVRGRRPPLISSTLRCRHVDCCAEWPLLCSCEGWGFSPATAFLCPCHVGHTRTQVAAHTCARIH
jgi:hypothetical protein